MRIVYDHQAFSLQDAGGASRYHFELLRHLKAQPEFQVLALMGFNSSRYPFLDLRQSNVRVLGSQTLIRPGSARYLVNEAVVNAEALFNRTADIYHPTLYRTCPLIRARRIVVTHHDCVHERFPHLFRNAKTIIGFKQKLFARADAIICISQSSRRDLLEFYNVSPEKTCVIHHGHTRLANNLAPATELRDRVRRPYLLYVGSRAQYKNFGSLLLAYRSTGAQRDFDLVAVGGGPFTHEETLEIKRLGIHANVQLFPRADDALLADAYANATLFVYPSRYEGFGFPPLEAMSSGCPALVSNRSSLPEICGDAVFYFDPDSPESLGSQLNVLLVDEYVRKAKAAKGNQRAIEYDWNVCAMRTYALYKACLKGENLSVAA